MDALTFHLMVKHLHLLSGVLGTLFVLLATVIRNRTLWRVGTAAIAVAALSVYPVQWTGDRATGRAGVASWCRRGAVVVPSW